MLRSLQSRYLLPVLQGLQLTTAVGGTSTVSIGAQETASSTRNAAGKSTTVLNDKLSRVPVVVTTPSVNIANGGFACYDTAATVSNLVAETLGRTGIGDDGTVMVLSVGFESDAALRSDKQTVIARAASPRLMGVRVNADGTIGTGQGQFIGSATPASSAFTLNFANAFGRNPIVVASPIAATVKSLRCSGVLPGSAEITTFDPVGNVPKDNAFYALILGWDTPDEQTGLRRAVQVPQLRPRLEVFKIEGADGSPEITIGADAGSVTDNGVGEYALAFSEPFLREPIVIVTAKDGRAQLAANATASGVDIVVFSADELGNSLDDDVYVVVLGFDSDTEV